MVHDKACILLFIGQLTVKWVETMGERDGYDMQKGPWLGHHSFMVSTITIWLRECSLTNYFKNHNIIEKCHWNLNDEYIKPARVIPASYIMWSSEVTSLHDWFSYSCSLIHSQSIITF